jgi:two-component system, NtrC family, sensor kinase
MKRSHTLQLVLALLLALLCVALGGLSVERKVRSFQPLGFAAAAPSVAAGGVVVGSVAEPRTGLRPGDQVLLADGGEVSGPRQLAERLHQRPESTLVVLRAGQLQQVRYHRPPLAPDVPYVILALIGVAYLLIGLYTLLRQGGGQGFLFYLWCLVSAVFYLLTPVPPLDGVYAAVYLGDELARLLLPALTLHLFLVFPAPLEAAAKVRRIFPFLYLPAAVFATLQVDLVAWNGRFLFGRPTEARLARLDRLEVLHLAVFALAAVALLGYRLWRGRSWEQRRQMQWVAYGLAAGYLPFLLLAAAPYLLGLHAPQLLTVAAVLPLALVPVSFAYGILRYKLWDIEVIVRDTIASTLTLLLGIIGFSLVNLAISRGLSREMEVAHDLLSFASGLAIAGLLLPTRKGISSVLERLHYRDSFGKRRALSGLGRELLLERDLSRLCTALLEQVEAGVDLHRADLYLVLGDALVPVRGEPELPPKLPLDALGEEAWKAEFVRLSGVALPAEPVALRQRLFIAGYRYAFPLAVRGRGIGLMLTGFKRDQAPLNSEDAQLIRHLLDQAALAIENAQLVGQLHRQLEEVQRLQHYSEGIFESSPAGIAVIDGERRLVSVNAALAQLAGVAPAERSVLLGRRLEDVLPVSSLPAPGEAPVEASYCDAGGGERCLQLSLAEFDGGRQRNRLHVLVVHDVTERVAMENALKEKDRLAALGMLAAGVAHEVNTPITGISSYAQMLLSETAENDPHYAILKKVERQTFRAARIVNNLLEFARNRQKERRPVALEPLLRECVDLLGERWEKRRIEIAWTVPRESAVVMGCDGELQQVFTNLLLNAFDAMSERGGRLAIELALDAGHVRVEIEDSGPGIPPEKLASIFEPFYSTKLNRGGTGLGLSISHDIVRRHGGEMRVVSRPGEGARFTVELPRHPSRVEVPA